MFGGVRDPEACEGPEGVEPVRLDVTDAASIEALGRRLSGEPLDVLINNAAIRGDDGGLQTLDPEDFLQVMQVNVLGPLMVTRALLPNLRAGRRKVVANIGSRAGSMVEGTIDDEDGDIAYRCSKAALNMVTRKLAHDLRASEVSVISLHSGWIKTDMGGNGADLGVDTSAAGLMEMIDTTKLMDTGSFRAYDGSAIAW